MKVGTRIKDLSTHRLTRAHHVGGSGVVTAIKLTDPVNHRGIVWVRTKSGNYLHIETEVRT